MVLSSNTAPEPLGTDYLIAYALAEEAGRRAGVLVLPLIPFGVSIHHSAFPGTVWVREEVLKEYLKDAILSLREHGIRKVIVVNRHGGNLPAIISLARELRREFARRRIPSGGVSPGWKNTSRRKSWVTRLPWKRLPTCTCMGGT